MRKDFLGFIACLSILVSCGGDDSNSGSGVSSSKKISELSNDEAKKLCLFHADDFIDISKNACVFSGLSASTVEQCEQLQSECLAEESKEYDAGLSDSDVECEDTDMTEMVACTATVGEFESCIRELLSYFNKLTCSILNGSMPAMPSCFSTIGQKCPSMFGEIEESISSQ